MKMRRNSGGILVVTLCLLLVAAALTSGWVIVMTSEVNYVEVASEGIQRRIAIQNATGVVRQKLLSGFLTKNGMSAAEFDLGNDWGAASIPAATGTPLATFDRPAGFNPFNPGNGGGYTRDLNVGLISGDHSVTRRFRVRSRSAVLSGSLAIFNSPSTSVTGSLTVAGQTLVWLPAGSFSTTSGSYAAPSAPSAPLGGPGGAAIPVSNFPFVPLTGSEVSGIANFAGVLNVVANASGINSLIVTATGTAPNGVQTIDGSIESSSAGVECDGEGELTIDLLEPALGNVIVTGNVTGIRFVGQETVADFAAAGNAAAVIVVVHQTAPATDLVAVTFEHSNNRRLALAIRTVSGNGTLFDFPQAGAGTWRLVCTLEQTPLTLTLGGATQTVLGGIQSDSNLAVASGALAIGMEPDPKLLDRLAARDGWLEVFTP